MPQYDIVEALAVPQGLIESWLHLVCMPDFPRIFLFTTCAVLAALRLLRTPDLLGDDELVSGAAASPVPGSWL